MPKQSIIDLSDLRTSGQLEIKPPESPEEQASRLRREEAEHRQRLRGQVAIFTSLAALTAICLAFAIVGPDDATRRFCQGIVTTVVGGAVGFYLGKTAK